MKQIPHELWREIRPCLEDAPVGQFDMRLEACINDLFDDISAVAARMLCCKAVALREVRKHLLRRMCWCTRILYLKSEADKVVNEYLASTQSH